MRLFGALLFVTTLACELPVVSSGAAIVDGTPTTGDPAVVGLAMRRASCEQSPGFICTGTLIAPRVVMTAAHCLARGGGIEVYFGSNPATDASGQLMLASSFAIAPGYDDATGADDLGLLQLPREAAVAPLALGDAPPAVATLARIVGFGATVGDGIPDGLKRSGTMTVAAVDDTTITLSPAPSNSCVGDSGGPLIAGAPGAEQLVGVTVRGDPGCVTSAVAERIDHGDLAAFIASFVAAAESAPTEPGFGGQDFSGVCTTRCLGDADCPAGLTCQTSGDSDPRCVVPSNLPGSLGESCAHDSDCGAQGTCARLDPDSCRCLRPCPTSTGCGLTVGYRSTRYDIVIMLLFAALWITRRRFERTNSRL